MKKRLLITTGIYSPDIGGPATYAKQLATKMAVLNDVTVVTYSSVWSDSQDNKESYKIIRIWKKWPRSIRHVLYFLKNFFAFRKADFAYSLSTLNGGLTLWLASRLFKKQYAIRVVGDWAWEYAMNHSKTTLLIDDFQNAKKKGRVRRLARMRAFTARKALTVIVPSNYLAHLIKNWGVSEGAIKVIPNSVDIPNNLMSTEEARKVLAIPGRIILSVGRLVTWKGFRMLIKLMPKLLELDPFFRLVIVGDGPDKKILFAYIKNLHLEGKVFLVGRKSQEELETYYGAADFFVLNTGYEGFSHTIVEAMAHRIPVITTSIPGNQEIIEQGENGFLVKYNDEFNLYEAIKTLRADDVLSNKFRDNGLSTAKRFTVKRMTEATEAILFPNS